MYLPLFPLKLIAFPGEELNLHIFEPRYRQLIADAESAGLNFGICSYLDQITGYGTEVHLEQVFKRYEDGRLDIKTRGVRIFKILNFENPMKGKLYSGGEIEYLNDDLSVTEIQQLEYVFYLKELLYLLNYPAEFEPFSVKSYSFAHKVGLKLEEELELLQFESESLRIEYLIKHYKRMIPMIKAVESAKEKIKLNGHFKHLDPLNF